MNFEATSLKDLFVIQPKVFEDSRGYFYESFNQRIFESGLEKKIAFYQDNQSRSQKNVLRGLHFQNPPHAQGKLVRVLNGSVLDVVVDIRTKSSTYGQHFKTILSAKNYKMMYIPEGFAHGFLTLEDNTIFSYKCTNYYHKKSEDCLLWNDKELNIDWGIDLPILSEKDEIGKKFSSFVSEF